ncbi:MAG: hypothetical protein IJZ44_05370 [Lachnospiraceae bacterium]|nr:hypothetical protein [Lachnospiraceae bacterium]
MKLEKLLRPELSGVPEICSACGAKLTYKGLGEYECPKCFSKEYDNYGKVRTFLEKHPGASVPEVCFGTGLTRAEVTKMVDEGKFKING